MAGSVGRAGGPALPLEGVRVGGLPPVPPRTRWAIEEVARREVVVSLVEATDLVRGHPMVSIQGWTSRGVVAPIRVISRTASSTVARW